MQKRLRIINSTEIEPDDEHYVIIFGAGTMNMKGLHSNESYIDQCHKLERGTLVYSRLNMFEKINAWLKSPSNLTREKAYILSIISGMIGAIIGAII